MLTYFEPKLYLLIIHYTCTSYLLNTKILAIFKVTAYVYTRKHVYSQGESEMYEQTLGVSSTYQNKKTRSHKCGSHTLPFRVQHWKNALTRIAQNFLHETEYMIEHILSWTVEPFQISRNSCEQSGRGSQCTGEMSLRCAQELNTQGLLSAPTGINLEDSYQESVWATQWAILCLSSRYDKCCRGYLSQHCLSVLEHYHA
jgi:hypothetical protein